MKKAYIVFIIFISMTTIGCLKGTEYPPEPSLKFKSMRTNADSAVLVFEFIDGDGNFGLGQGDTSGVFDDCLKKYNLFSEYSELQNGIWVPRPIDPCLNPDAVPFYYRVPLVEPTGQMKSQKGEVKVVMTPFYYLSGSFDTCRFTVHILDRDFNESNSVFTSIYIKP